MSRLEIDPSHRTARLAAIALGVGWEECEVKSVKSGRGRRREGSIE